MDSFSRSTIAITGLRGISRVAGEMLDPRARKDSSSRGVSVTRTRRIYSSLDSLSFADVHIRGRSISGSDLAFAK